MINQSFVSSPLVCKIIENELRERERERERESKLEAHQYHVLVIYAISYTILTPLCNV